MTRPASALLLLALVAACARSTRAPDTAPPVATAAVAAPATPAAASIAGTYEFATIARGETVAGTIVITGEPGAYGGHIDTNVFGRLPVNAVRREGDAVVVVTTIPQGETRLEFTLDGDTLRGQWFVGGDSGTLTGRRRAR